MAVEFDTTISGEDSTSYASIAEADQYAENYSLSDWLALSSDDLKKQYLNKAAQYLDGFYGDSWRGVPAEADQALSWPRSGVYKADGSLLASDQIPKAVKNAQIEAANFFASGTDITADQGPAATREKLDGLGEIEYRDYGVSSALPVRTRIDQLIKFPLVEQSGSGSLRMVLS